MSTSPALDPATAPLPTVADFAGDPAAHRAWYRDHIAALILRSDMTGEQVAAAVGVSGKTITDWVESTTGMKPRQWRKAHGVVRHRAPAPVPVMDPLRFHPGMRCADGVPADVVDLRHDAARARRPVEEVLAAAPSDKPRWEMPVRAEGFAGVSDSEWLVEGYGIGSNKEFGTSVLRVSQSDPDVTGTVWRLVVITDARSHGRFAMSWCTEVLPLVATALRTTGGVKRPQDYRDAQYAAHKSLDALARGFTDPEGWIGDPSFLPRGWDRNLPWHSSVENLTLMLTWAGAGAGQMDTVTWFQEQDWGPDTGHFFWVVGADDFEEITAMLRVAGRCDINRVAPLLEEIHRAGFSSAQTIDWLRSPLGQWFFNHPELAARMLAHGWDRDSILEIGHRVATSDEPRRFNVEVLLWERAIADLRWPWTELLPVRVPVLAGLSRTELRHLFEEFRESHRGAGSGDLEGQRPLVEQFCAPLVVMAGLRGLSDVDRARAKQKVDMVLADRVPRGYPKH